MNKAPEVTIRILKLLLLVAVIVIIFFIKFKYDEHFINSNGDLGPLGAQLVPPTLNWYPPNQTQYPQYPQKSQQYYYDNNTEQMYNHPLVYTQQLYPRNPYTPRLGQPCDQNHSCGAVGRCVNGICEMPNITQTAFNVPV